LVRFAKRNLKLNIKFASSKSRDALIGTIVVEVVQKSPHEIQRFYNALEKILRKEQTTEGKKDIFGEWNKVISKL